MALVKHAAIAAAYKRHECAHVNKQRNGDAIVEPDQAYTPRELLSMFCRGTLPQMAERREYDDDPSNEEPQWVPCMGQPRIDICEKRDELLARVYSRKKPESQEPQPLAE